MSVKIDDIELIARVEETDRRILHEIRSVRRIEAKEKRILLENEIAGQEGNALRDYGRRAIRVALEGEVIGEDAKNTVSSLRLKYRAGEPLDFSSDLPALSEIRKIMIAELTISQKVGEPNSFHYRMAFVEHREPPPSEEGAPSQEDGAEEEVEKESEIDDIRGQILDSDGNPVKGVTVVITGPSGEIRVETDSDGFYESLDLPEGKYEITVDAEGFEGQKTEVEIKKEGSKG